MDETPEVLESNGAQESKPKRRRIGATAESEPKAGRKAEKKSSLKEAADAEPVLKKLGAKIEKHQAAMGKLIKDREKVLKALSPEARRHLGISE